MKASNARPGGPSSDLPPLLRAVQSRDPAAVEKILGTMHNDHQLEQARAPRTQNTALHLAAGEGASKVTAKLVELGADVKRADRQGRNALEIARAAGYYDLEARLRLLSES